MRQTYYKKSLKGIAEGFVQLGISIVNTVLNNKLLTLLIVSVIANFILMFSLMGARAERDKYNADLYHTECQLDSVNIIVGKE